jgi:hypothetical protein
MANNIPFAAVRDAIDDLQLAHITIADEARIVERLADIAAKYSRPLADAMRTSARTIHEETFVAIGAGERFHEEHCAMVDQVRKMKRKRKA